MNPTCIASPPNSAVTGQNRALLLGVGNEFLSDDAVGLRVVREARPRLSGLPNLEISEVSEMGLSLLDSIVGFDRLIVVDAIQTGHASPGCLHELEGVQFKALSTRAPHRLGLGEVLALGKRLGLAVPNRVSVLAIEVEDPFTVGTDLSLAVRQRLPRLVEEVIRRITYLITMNPVEADVH